MTDPLPTPRGRPRINTPTGPAAQIGRQIRTRRESAGLSQIELAEQIGVVPRTLGSYECGERVPPLDTASRIAQVLGCTVNDLLA